MIRQAVTTDAQQICKIYNHYIANTCFTFDENAKDVEHFIKEINSGNPWLITEENSEVIGFAYTSLWKTKTAYRFTHESTIYLKPDMHRQGIGTELYKSLICRAKNHHIHSLLACIVLPHDQSIHFHEKLGFKKAAHFKRVGFKFEKWLDVGYWQLELN